MVRGGNIVRPIPPFPPLLSDANVEGAAATGAVGPSGPSVVPSIVVTTAIVLVAVGGLGSGKGDHSKVSVERVTGVLVIVGGTSAELKM